ncbi:MAG TPA: ribosome maturation factor RimM [Candidatus Binatia bacterium]
MSWRSSKRNNPTASPSEAPDRLVSLGEIVATHGIDGWLKLRPYNPNSPTLLATQEIFLEKNGARSPQRLESVKPHKNQLLVRLAGVDGINAAKKWIGSTVSVVEAQLPPLNPDEYYYYQVVGLDVFDTKSNRIGTIARITSTPACDLYVVEGEAKEYLIPVTKEVIEKIDLAAGRVIIDPPEGLLEL